MIFFQVSVHILYAIFEYVVYLFNFKLVWRGVGVGGGRGWQDLVKFSCVFEILAIVHMDTCAVSLL